MKIEEITSLEDEASPQPHNSSLPSVPSISQPPKHFFRSRCNRSLIIRIRIGPRPIADQPSSITHPKCWSSSKKFVHQYDVLPRIRHTSLTTLIIKFNQMRVTLRKQPIMLRFNFPKSSKPLWDKRLRALPQEVRNKVFKETMRSAGDDRTPNFMKV